MLAYALTQQNGRSWRQVALPTIILLTLALWMALQLVPLPASVWSGLPGHATIAQVSTVTGQSDISRPLTLSPMKTANSLASLVVPLAALSLLSLFDDDGWRRAGWIVIGAGTASAVVGIAQIAFPGSDALFFYDITNANSAVGLFSNRNHNAILLVIALIYCGLRIEQIDQREMTPHDIAVIAMSMVIFIGLMVNAARMGLAGLGVAGLILGARTLLSWRRQKKRGKRSNLKLYVAVGVGLAAIGMVAIFALAGQSPAIERLLAEDPAGDLRVLALPYVLGMLGDYQPYGAGFGAFEHAFRMVEPESMLGPRYFNHAHNDWLQFPLEGGVPAILIGVFGLAAIVLRTVRISRMQTGSKNLRRNALLGVFTLLILALASLLDYPLRTPSLMLIAILALAMLFRPIPAIAGNSQLHKTSG